MIVGPIQAQMDDFCDLHGTPDTPVSRIVTVKLTFFEGFSEFGLIVAFLNISHTIFAVQSVTFSLFFVQCSVACY